MKGVRLVWGKDGLIQRAADNREKRDLGPEMDSQFSTTPDDLLHVLVSFLTYVHDSGWLFSNHISLLKIQPGIIAIPSSIIKDRKTSTVSMPYCSLTNIYGIYYHFSFCCHFIIN